MTALEQRLHVDLSKVRAEGLTVEIAPPEPKRYPRGVNMPNVTQAVETYQASDKAWGRLTRIALQFKTTPGSILGRINRGKKL